MPCCLLLPSLAVARLIMSLFRPVLCLQSSASFHLWAEVCSLSLACSLSCAVPPGEGLKWLKCHSSTQQGSRENSHPEKSTSCTYPCKGQPCLLLPVNQLHCLSLRREVSCGVKNFWQIIICLQAQSLPIQRSYTIQAYQQVSAAWERPRAGTPAFQWGHLYPWWTVASGNLCTQGWQELLVLCAWYATTQSAWAL